MSALATVPGKSFNGKFTAKTGADPGYVKRGGRDPKGVPGGCYNPKIAPK